jgi:chemotaxis regulatin CheY-phosphate phosphatase CheZ
MPRRIENKPKRGAVDSGRSVSQEITALMNTLRELAAIRSTAEDAAGRILESAEGLLAFADKEEAKKAEEAILSIMTACGFHDLVGQRVTKITKTLDAVIATRLKGASNKARPNATSRAQKAKSGLALDGPDLTSDAQTQARIDALFSDA